LGIGELDNVRTAEIGLNATINKKDTGMTSKYLLAGHAQVDLASGMTLASSINGTFDFDGTSQQGDAQIVMSGHGQVKSNSTRKPSGNDRSNFSGAFRNEKLAVDLESAGDGTYAGSITMGTHKFPAKARVSDGRLVGTFDSNGNSFDFSASVDGSVMSFASGSKTYTLNKVSNPLSDAPAQSRPNTLDP
jgi:hypothetical protein